MVDLRTRIRTERISLLATLIVLYLLPPGSASVASFDSVSTVRIVTFRRFLISPCAVQNQRISFSMLRTVFSSKVGVIQDWSPRKL